MYIPLPVPARVHLLHKRRVAIKHAQILCGHFDKSKKDCEVAWDYVEDLSNAIHKLDEMIKEQTLEQEDARRVERAQREYDC